MEEALYYITNHELKKNGHNSYSIASGSLFEPIICPNNGKGRCTRWEKCVKTTEQSFWYIKSVPYMKRMVHLMHVGNPIFIAVHSVLLWRGMVIKSQFHLEYWDSKSIPNWLQRLELQFYSFSFKCLLGKLYFICSSQLLEQWTWWNILFTLWSNYPSKLNG